MSKSTFTKISILIIGIVAGALLFSQFNSSSAPIGYTYPDETAVSQRTDDRSIRSLDDLNEAFVEIAKKVNPKVVTVFTEKVFTVRRGFGSPFFFENPFEDFFEEFFGPRSRERQQPKEREYRQQGLGSGVIMSEDGYILTNNHVVEGADTIQIRFMNEKTLAAKVVGKDPKTDIAVIKVNAKNLPAIEYGNSDDLNVGEWVLAVGSPMSPNLAHSVTSGIVSAKGRSNVGLADYEDFIQTDAAINPGNSGGALVNLHGELVGINTAIASRSGGFQGIGFAVPVNMARNVMESLIKHGKVIRGWLGVYIQDIDETMAEAMDLPVTEGALVSDVVEDGPAEKAGIEQEDVITEFAGKKVKNSTELRNTVAGTAPDTEVKIKVLRDGEEKTLTVKLGKLEAEEIATKTEEKIEDLFGFRVSPFTNEMAEQYNLDKSLNGVVITNIKQISRAFRAGLREGDLIAAVNRNEINSIEDFKNLVQQFKKGDKLFFKVIRRNRSFFVAFAF